MAPKRKTRPNAFYRPNHFREVASLIHNIITHESNVGRNYTANEDIHEALMSGEAGLDTITMRNATAALFLLLNLL